MRNGFVYFTQAELNGALTEIGATFSESAVGICDTGSLYESASNALLEAMNCGLPVIYADSGGQSEFAWYAGLSFDRAEQIPGLLDKMVRDYDQYKSCVYSLKIPEVALVVCRLWSFESLIVR